MESYKQMKNKQIRRKITFCLMIATVSCPLLAIQKTTANINAGLFTILSAVGGYQGYIKSNGAAHPAFFGAASITVSSAMYYFLHSITPEGRLKKANKHLDDLERHKLVKNSFNNNKSFADAVNDIYLTDDLPLISAYNHLIKLLPSIHYAFGLISKASAEVGKDSLLQEQCDSASSRAKTLFGNMSDAIKRVRENKDYLAQLQIYKEFLASEKKAELQEQMVSAQLQMAHAQSSNTLLKWLKALFWRK